ncbi:Imm1 family immunity protein [Streptomyces lavendulae]|uniref:Imm1 family immunity protein n=1 Tax=Streptomyces lavendulae TaxID=1914 RepID=UPI0024A05B03|nr:hypothetical protein Slala05_75790 [Streptomyces lavendulae subsp. lavendulae]
MCFSRQPRWVTRNFQIVTSESAETDNVLGVGVDHESGFGGLVWYCMDDVAERVAESQGEEVADYVWVSRNLSPPAVDPEVVYDRGGPTCFNRISAIPVEDVRSSVLEYYREGTGFRPTCVEWIKGNFTGELYEEE